ncbi:hypothetical protein [Priestia aryabhattai]
MSPLLANIALCGMEEEIGIVYKKTYKPNGGYAIDPKCKIGGFSTQMISSS